MLRRDPRLRLLQVTFFSPAVGYSRYQHVDAIRLAIDMIIDPFQFLLDGSGVWMVAPKRRIRRPG